MLKYGIGLYWSGKILAIAVGVFVGIEQGQASTGIATMFALQLLVDIRHKDME